MVEIWKVQNLDPTITQHPHQVSKSIWGGGQGKEPISIPSCNTC